MTFLHKAPPVALALFALACVACGAPEAEDDRGTPESTLTSTEMPTPARAPSDELPAAAQLGDVDDDAPTPPEAPAPGDPDSPTPAEPDPGPKPAGTCSVTRDGQGFFTRTSSKGSYVAYVPASYDGSKPMRAVVGMHGCGDTAASFATWGVAPYDGRATQDHIAISVGSQSGNNNCWVMGTDDDKVLAALDDLSACFWIHQKKVTVAGFSSGGQLAYRVGMKHADRFAGILIENSSLYAAGNADTLLAGASRKLPVVHRAHSGDTVFPLAKVQADWTKISAAGHPLESSVVAGGHDGSSADWLWLLPRSAAFALP